MLRTEIKEKRLFFYTACMQTSPVPKGIEVDNGRGKEIGDECPQVTLARSRLSDYIPLPFFTLSLHVLVLFLCSLFT